jgi:hypothetical protein
LPGPGSRANYSDNWHPFSLRSPVTKVFGKGNRFFFRYDRAVELRVFYGLQYDFELGSWYKPKQD